MAKQGIGLSLLGLGFVVMYLAEQGGEPRAAVSPLWLIAVYFIFTVAELCVSPIGLSLVNKLAHPRVASLMMASWFLCTAAANYLAGIMEETARADTTGISGPSWASWPSCPACCCWP